MHDGTLPGKPDFIFAEKRKIIFVHGCFWHQHSCRRGARVPSSNRAYWKRKLEGNRLRDRLTTLVLRREGWDVLVIWECWTREARLEWLLQKITKFLRCPNTPKLPPRRPSRHLISASRRSRDRRGTAAEEPRAVNVE
jgi:DNA mismatch endonuclease (patch repair protein)